MKVLWKQVYRKAAAVMAAVMVLNAVFAFGNSGGAMTAFAETADTKKLDAPSWL